MPEDEGVNRAQPRIRRYSPDRFFEMRLGLRTAEIYEQVGRDFYDRGSGVAILEYVLIPQGVAVIVCGMADSTEQIFVSWASCEAPLATLSWDQLTERGSDITIDETACGQDTTCDRKDPLAFLDLPPMAARGLIEERFGEPCFRDDSSWCYCLFPRGLAIVRFTPDDLVERVEIPWWKRGERYNGPKAE